MVSNYAELRAEWVKVNLAPMPVELAAKVYAMRGEPNEQLHITCCEPAIFDQQAKTARLDVCWFHIGSDTHGCVPIDAKIFEELCRCVGNSLIDDIEALCVSDCAWMEYKHQSRVWRPAPGLTAKDVVAALRSDTTLRHSLSEQAVSPLYADPLYLGEATGHDLDQLAAMLNLVRRFRETDDALRQRIKAYR